MKYCHCIKGSGKFSVRLETLSCKTLLITDLSDWMTELPYTVPNDFEINIIPPGGQALKAKLKPGHTVQIEVYPELYLMDGIYCISTVSCENTEHHIYRAVLCKMECCKRQYLADINSDHINISELDMLERYMQLVYSSAEAGQVEKANNFIRLSNKIISTLNCNCQ